jgi:hypothetical protein
MTTCYVMLVNQFVPGYASFWVAIDQKLDKLPTKVSQT